MSRRGYVPAQYTHITEKALNRLWPEGHLNPKDTTRACDGVPAFEESILDGPCNDPLWCDWLMSDASLAEVLLSCPKCAVLRDRALEHYRPPEAEQEEQK